MSEKEKKEVKENKTIKYNNIEKKKSTLIPTAIVIIAVLLIAALLTYMIVTSSDPKKTVDGFFTNLKAGEFEKAKQFVNGDEDVLKNKNFNQETLDLLFNKMTWKITKISKENDEATVEFEITNKDFQKVIENSTKSLVNDIKTVLSGGSIEQSKKKYFVEELKKDQVETKTVTKTLKLVKQDKTWKVVADDDLIYSLLPGFQETANKLNY